MSAKAKPSAARVRSRIKQLSCLGLGTQALVPELLRELHALVPSYCKKFYWVNPNGEINNFYTDSSEALEYLPLYLSEFYGREDKHGHITFAEFLRRGTIVSTSDSHRDPKVFFKSDLYNSCLRPAHDHHNLYLVLRVRAGHTLGVVQLSRDQGEADWTPQERRTVAAMAPYFAHALAAPMDSDVPLVESTDTGLLITEPSGRIQHVSAQARRLLWMATTPQVTPKCRSGNGQDIVLPAGVRNLCRQLDAVFRNDPYATPPVYQQRNAWGGFTFRAYWLNGGEPEPAPLIGITVSRQEPLPLKLIRGPKQWPLTNRQLQVCVLLASGYSLANIADRLKMTRHTANYHCREVYARFDVHSRSELIAKLMAA